MSVLSVLPDLGAFAFFSTLHSPPTLVDPDCLVDMDEDVRPLLEQQSHPAVLFHSHFVDLVETHAAIPFAMTRTNAGPLPALYDGILQSREKRDEQVRKVVEQYCESDKLLKELRVEKECYGWNWKLLEQVRPSPLVDRG